MKKLKSLLLTLAMLLCSFSASAHDFEVDGIYYNIKNSEELTVEVTYKGYSYSAYSDEYTGKVVIPETVIYSGKTYSVTMIGYHSFRDCSGLISVTIPNSVTIIGQYAFSGCSTMTSVTIPNCIESIYSYAFSGCTSLVSITIPQSVTRIGKYAFEDCSGLTSVHITDIAAWCNIEFVDKYANPLTYAYHLYMDGKEINKLIIPEGVTSIHNYAFNFCESLTSVTIPNSVTSIGNSAFFHCYYLTSINIPNSVTSIGENAFYRCFCTNLTSITIPNSVIHIGKSAFSQCSKLTSVILPDEITTIEESTFWYCEGLKNVILPKKLYMIKKEAFYGCKGLESITIPAGVEYIYQSAFYYCYVLKNVKVLAETPPFAYDYTFINYNAELCVPKNSITAYQKTSPWSKFSTFKTLTGEDYEVKKCATPTISYENGKLIFNCETEGAVCKSTITDDDVASFEANEVQLNVTYNISVYATKEGYKDSEVAKATLCWIDVEPKSEGLTNTDIANVKALPVVAQANNGTITVSGADDGTMVEVYGISGTKLGEAKTTLNTATIHTDAQAGSIVIVKVGNKSIKIKI